MKTSIFFLVMLLVLAGCTTPTEDETKIRDDSTLQLQEFDESKLALNQAMMNNIRNIKIEVRTPKFDFSPITKEGKPQVHFFHSPRCGACKAIAPEIERLEKEYQEIVFIRHDIATQKGTRAYIAFAEQYNLSTNKRLVPQVLVNGTIITDRFNINKSLEEILEAIQY